MKIAKKALNGSIMVSSQKIKSITIEKLNIFNLVEEYLRNNAGEAGAAIFQWDFFSLFQKNKKSASFGNYGRGHSKTRYFFY